MNTKKLYRKLVLLYLKYKDSPYYSLSLYMGILVVCAIVTLYVIIPQVKNWFSIQEEVKETEERIDVMNENIRLLQVISDSQLEEDFQTASTAYPPERDISSLISVINAASLRSGVGLDDFTFQAGEISSRSSGKRGAKDEAEITFSVNGTFSQVTMLLKELNEKIPLLSIKEINAQFAEENGARVTVRYYYKAFPLISRDTTTPLKDITAENKELLRQLRAWDIATDEFTGSTGSDSAASPF